MKVDEIGERGLIKKIMEIVGAEPDEGYLGIGDDASLVKLTAGKWLVTSKDLLVENIHFLMSATTAYDLGHKSLAVNLSDIAAMGAMPRHAYVALALPKGTEVEYVLEFYRGMQALASRYNVRISGGDIVGTPGPLVISVTVQGEVDRQQALLRSGARPGHILCVTGELGASAAGLILLQQQTACPEDVCKAALGAHHRPQPRVDEAAFLASSGMVTAALDISDGLLKDLGEICENSGCGALLYEDQIPVHRAASQLASLRKTSGLDLALHGGEDYELLCAVKPEDVTWLAAEYSQRFGNSLYAVGEVTAERGIRMITKDGKRETLYFKGFQHF
jgi:thiamine-monophosphate kinase